MSTLRRKKQEEATYPREARSVASKKAHSPSRKRRRLVKRASCVKSPCNSSERSRPSPCKLKMIFILCACALERKMMVRPVENDRVQRATRSASLERSPDRNPRSIASPGLSPRTRRTVHFASVADHDHIGNATHTLVRDLRPSLPSRRF